MNKDRRKRISALISELSAAGVTLSIIHERIQELLQEESEAYDNMPESIQNSEKGCASDTAAGLLEDADSELDAAIENVNNTLDHLNEIE